MGCRHSRNKNSNNDFTVESLHYRKRSSNCLGRKSKKGSRKSTKSSGSEQASCAANAPEGGRDGDQVPSDGDGAGSSSARLNCKTSPTSLSAGKDGKNTNERIPPLFGARHQPDKNTLANSVDSSSTSGTEQRHARFGKSHVFPVWDSSYHEPCHCVNLDLAATTQSSPKTSPDAAGAADERRRSSSTARLCRRCSQTVLKVQNNKRGSGSASSNNNNNNQSVDSVGAAGPPAMTEVKDIQIVAIANLLALAALDLSAPASSILVKNRKNAWIQLAGHPGAFAPAGPNSIWKKRIAKENYETVAYQALSENIQSRDIIPSYHREVEFNGEYFIEMEDLLHYFNDPSIMDIKMGTRTFLEAEVKNPVLRKDLFEKMVKLDPEAPTAEERDNEAITKLRYMQFREHESSTASLGFRIEAIRMSGEPPNTNLKKVKTREEVSYFIQSFTKGHNCVIPSLRDRLKDVRAKFESIPFFKSHEIIGSSLLIMFDSSNHSGMWMIDFAKTIPVPDVTLNHRSPWQLGNHEDGYLFGLDHLVEIFDDLASKIEDEDTAKDDEIQNSSS